jgi:hypothetical protein
MDFVERRSWLGLRETSTARDSVQGYLPEATAWRVFTKGIAPESTRSQVEIEGDEALALGILGLTAIVG